MYMFCIKLRYEKFLLIGAKNLVRGVNYRIRLKCKVASHTFIGSIETFINLYTKLWYNSVYISKHRVNSDSMEILKSENFKYYLKRNHYSSIIILTNASFFD